MSGIMDFVARSRNDFGFWPSHHHRDGYFDSAPLYRSGSREGSGQGSGTRTKINAEGQYGLKYHAGKHL